MGQDKQPKHRVQARDLRRQAAIRKPYERLLIVCEGSKTEPNYIGEIRAQYKLPTANVLVLPSELGTAPIQIVEYAEQMLLHGDSHARIGARAFDQVFAVFDRDDHASYDAALAKCQSLDNVHRNSDKERVRFYPIASVPCFELWLLLHFEDIQAPLHRDEAYARLANHLGGYEKGQSGHWALTRMHLEVATQRAHALSLRANARNGQEPFTAMHELVRRLITLKN